MNDLLIDITSFIPSQGQLIAIGIALGIIFVALLFAHFFSKFLSPQVVRLIQSDQNTDHDDMIGVINAIIGNIVAAMLIALALYLYKWNVYALILLAVTMTGYISLAAQKILRWLNIGFWSASGVSLALFIWTLINTLLGFGYKLQKSSEEDANTIGGFPVTLEFVITAVLVVIVFIAAIRLGGRLLSIILERNRHIDNGQKLLIEKLANVAMIVIGFLVAMDVLGIDLTALAFFSGAFGLAIGFGLQKTFGNLISGIILLMDRSIKPGDVIAVGDSFGWVNKIGIRAVSIITRDGKEHLIPNENMMINEVENWSYSSKNVRVRIPVGVAYSSDIRKVEEILLALAKDHKRILKRPEPRVLIKGFGDNSVDFEFRIWIRDPEEGVSNIKSDVMKQIWFDFEEHSVEFPFPQRDVHLDINPKTLAALNKKRD